MLTYSFIFQYKYKAMFYIYESLYVRILLKIPTFIKGRDTVLSIVLHSEILFQSHSLKYGCLPVRSQIFQATCPTFLNQFVWFLLIMDIILDGIAIRM